jgi:xylulokinase
MAAPPYVLGIDLGTTTCRCAIFDLDGNEIAAAYCENLVSYPRPLWAEVEPESWWRCVVQVLREALAASGVDAASIAGVGLSGLMHAPVLLDGNGQPLAPAMLWMDQRCAPQCEAMRHESMERAPLLSTSVTAPKLRWLAEYMPDVLAQARAMLLPKDFVRYRLTGAICTDTTDASGTGMFDRELETWDHAAARLARVPPDILPPIRPSWASAGVLTSAAARETGLPAGVSVAVGGGDTFCTLLGAGGLATHEVCIYLGTAAWIALVDGVGADGQPRFGGFGATATTGAALRWVRDLLVDTPITSVSASYDLLTEQAGSVAPGSEGLFFLPHMMGERGPTADPLARGALVGLTLRHTRPHVVRAVLEGSAFHLRRLLEARVANHWHGQRLAAALACGGVTRSALWTQLLADIVQLPLRVPAVAEAAVLGAAILGGVAAGVLERENAAAKMVHSGRAYTPDPAHVARYNALYNRYCELDDLLAPWFRAAGTHDL